MDTDFPAAHSMDTTWYAVDREGFVASFDTGEDALIPSQALAVEWGVTPTWQNELLMAGDISVEARGRTLRRRAGDHYSLGPRAKGPAVFFLSSDDVAFSLADRHNGLYAVANVPNAVVFTRLRKSVINDIHRQDLCLGCYPYEGPELYSYHADNYGPFPYHRSPLPALPLHVDLLSPQVRSLLGTVCFEAVSFKDVEVLQPAEFFPCVGHDHYCWYVTPGANHIRPMPGAEEEYRQFYESGAREGYGFESEMTWEPPQPASDPAKRRRGRSHNP